jgi:thiol-disulfide isomerase/thioredoxin
LPSTSSSAPSEAPRRRFRVGWVSIASAALGVLIVLGIASWAVTASSDDEATTATAPPQSTPTLDEPRQAQPGEPAPGFTLPELDGEVDVSLADLTGKPLVINFWASWCIPCQKEFPILSDAVERYPDVQFVGITWRDIPGDAETFADEMNATWTLLEGDNGVAEAYGIRTVPQTLFVQPDGTIQQRLYQEFTSEEQFNGFIDDLVAASTTI